VTTTALLIVQSWLGDNQQHLSNDKRYTALLVPTAEYNMDGSAANDK